MGREDDRGSLFLEAQDLLADQLRIDRIEAGERFVQDHQGRFMDDRRDELDLLGHTLGEFLDLLVPPVFNSEFMKPFLELRRRLAGRHSLELGEVKALLPHLHFPVQSPFFGKVPDLGNVLIGNRPPVEEDDTASRNRYPVDDPDQGRLACPVRPQQAENLSFRDFKRDVVQRFFLSERLADMLNLNNRHIDLRFLQRYKKLLNYNK